MKIEKKKLSNPLYFKGFMQIQILEKKLPDVKLSDLDFDKFLSLKMSTLIY